MSITWRLHHPMPAELFEEMKVAAGWLAELWRNGVSGTFSFEVCNKFCAHFVI